MVKDFRPIDQWKCSTLNDGIDDDIRNLVFRVLYIVAMCPNRVA